MAVATSISPDALMELDAPMFDAMERAVRGHWSTLLELLAVQIEVTHGLYRAFVGVNSKKGTKLPQPLRVPRPGSEAERPRKLSASEFAFGLVGGRG